MRRGAGSGSLRHLEQALFAAQVARVHPYLGRTGLNGLQGKPVVKMNVRDQRDGTQ